MITTTTLLAWLGGMKEEKRGRITELQYVREGKKGKEMLSFFGNWAEDLRETRSRQKKERLELAIYRCFLFLNNIWDIWQEKRTSKLPLFLSN